MEHRIRHDLGSLERAREVVEKAYSEYQQKLSDYRPTLDWTDERRAKIGFTVMSKTIAVDATVDARDVTLSAKLPLLFRPFQSKVIAVIEAEVRKWVERANADG